MRLLNMLRQSFGQTIEPKEVNIDFDEAYSLWRLGFSLGEIIFKLKYSESLGDLPEIRQEIVNEQITKFQKNYFKILSNSSSINAGDIPEDLMSTKLIKHLKLIGNNLQDFISEIDKVKSNLAFEIQIFSTHLSNIFLFAYNLNKLKADLIDNNADEVKIHNTLDLLQDSIVRLEQGDKTIHTLNLELTIINLRILNIMLKKLKVNIVWILAYGTEQRVELIDKVFYKKMTDIILDIRNPKQIASYNFLKYVVYYYMVVLVIILIDYALDDGLSTDFGAIFDNENDDFEFMDLLFYIFPALVVALNKLNNEFLLQGIKWELKGHFKKFIKENPV